MMMTSKDGNGAGEVGRSNSEIPEEKQHVGAGGDDIADSLQSRVRTTS